MEKLLEENLFCQQLKIKNDSFQNQQNWQEISNQMNQILINSNPKKCINRSESQKKLSNKKTNKFEIRQSKIQFNLQKLQKKHKLLEKQDDQLFFFYNEKSQSQQNQGKQNNNFLVKLEEQLINSSKRIKKKSQFKQEKLKKKQNNQKLKQFDFVQQKQGGNQQQSRFSNKHISFQKLQSLQQFSSQQCSRKLISHNFCRLVQNQKNKKRLVNSRKKICSQLSKNSCKYLKKQQGKNINCQQKIKQKYQNNNLKLTKQNKDTDLKLTKQKKDTDFKLAKQNKENRNINIIHFQKNKTCLSVRSQRQNINQKKLSKRYKKMSQDKDMNKQNLCAKNSLYIYQKELMRKQYKKGSNNQQLKSNIEAQLKNHLYSQILQNKNKKSISFIIQKRIMKLQQKLKQTQVNIQKIKLSSLLNSHLQQATSNNHKTKQSPKKPQIVKQKLSFFPIIKFKSLSQNLKTKSFPKSRTASQSLIAQSKQKSSNKQNKLIKQTHQKNQNFIEKQQKKNFQSCQKNPFNFQKQKNLQLFKIKITGRTNKLVILRK